MKFAVLCDVPDRWVPTFLGMLKEMEHLGQTDKTQYVTMLSDGRGDFKPKFNAVIEHPADVDFFTPSAPHRVIDGDTTFFAGRTDIPK